MTTYRWTSSTRLKRHDTGETIAPGEVFEPTDSEIRAYGNQIEAIEDVEAEDTTAREQAVEENFGEEPESGIDPELKDVGFDEDAWFDDHDGYQDRVATVESGDVDKILDDIEAVERSEKVIEAVEARREGLENGED
ncbi:hypothetical protein [Halostagnicola sp. A-GB9-2]|uniref:hypothetical protein n=1 Tax=Halostagnicola sp. A-GB9-2 TaxID=3048066 RepID=UPI0024C06DE7|nr:hypothetical protein [Halostagnicola sp. A-GB9-2]MDJ1434779.1 hypothetical protein [Halostagnicola sp. A-GB9-2]